MERLPTGREGGEAMKPWHVVEQFADARDKTVGSEDGYVVTGHCIAVLDGVSSRASKERVYDLTPGQFAVRVGREILSDPNTNSANVVERLTNTLRETLGGYALQNTPSFVFAAFFPDEHILVRVGDCSYLFDGAGNNPGLSVDRAKAVIRRRGLLKLKEKGVSDDELLKETAMRDRLRGLQGWQEQYSNNSGANDFGYGVINGKEVPEQFVERIAVPLEVKEIVLASDGYPPEALRMTLQETETALRDIQQSDPLAVGEQPGTRAHMPTVEGQTATDDRTYVRIERA